MLARRFQALAFQALAFQALAFQALGLALVRLFHRMTGVRSGGAETASVVFRHYL